MSRGMPHSFGDMPIMDLIATCTFRSLRNEPSPNGFQRFRRCSIRKTNSTTRQCAVRRLRDWATSRLGFSALKFKRLVRNKLMPNSRVPTLRKRQNGSKCSKEGSIRLTAASWDYSSENLPYQGRIWMQRYSSLQ